MVHRIVKLTFLPENIEAFKTLFERVKNHIAQFEGCTDVKLLQCIHQPEVFFTFSIWKSEAHLNNYRHSALFDDTWTQTKALFGGKPEAWSTVLP